MFCAALGNMLEGHMREEAVITRAVCHSKMEDSSSHRNVSAHFEDGDTDAAGGRPMWGLEVA